MGRFRKLKVLAGASVLGAGIAGVAASAAFADSIGVTSTDVAVADAASSTLLGGVSVSDTTSPTQPLLVSLSTTLGSLSVSETCGLTLSYGYSGYSGSSFSFVGDQSQVQAALYTLTLSGDGTTGTAAVTVTVTANQSGIAYLPATGHYYEHVAASGLDWHTASSDAAALSFDG